MTTKTIDSAVAICRKYHTGLTPDAGTAGGYVTEEPLSSVHAKDLADALTATGYETSVSRDDEGRSWVRVVAPTATYWSNLVEEYGANRVIDMSGRPSIPVQRNKAGGVSSYICLGDDGKVWWHGDNESIALDHEPSLDEILADAQGDHRANIVAALQDLDRGDGCLGVTVDACLSDGITDAGEIRRIIEEAEADAKAEHDCGTLCEYSSGRELRPATREERDESREAASLDGGAGVILSGEVRCYVQE